MADNPLVGNFDATTVARVQDALGQALRPIRTRLINRISIDVPLSISRCEFVQLGVLRERLMEDEVRLLARLTLHPVGLPMMMGMDTGLLFRMIGMLLGEDPYGDPKPVDHRPFTQADLRIAKRLLGDLVDGLQEGLPHTVPGQAITIAQVTDDPYIDLGLPLSTGMIDAAIEIGEPENPIGTAVLSLPTTAVYALLPEPEETPQPERAERGLARVLPIRVDAIAELGRVQMRLSELENLDVGAVLPLGRPRSIEVRVRDRVALIAEPGTAADGTRCVRVLRNVHDLDQTA